MGFIDDMEDLPNKVAKPFITFGNIVANTGEDVIDKLEDYAETGYNSVKNVALQVSDKMEDIGETMWGGVLTAKDEIVDAANYIKDEGIPVLKTIGKKIAIFILSFYWIGLAIAYLICMIFAKNGAKMYVRSKGPLNPGLVSAIGLPLLFLIIYGFYRMNKALQNIKKSLQ